MNLIRRRTAVLLSATVLGGAALMVEPAAVRDLRFGDGTHHVTIGAVRTSLWSAALAQADTVVLENVTVTLGSVTYTAPRIEFTGVTSTRAEVEALVDKGSTEPLAGRLARINARQVTIPEIRSEQQAGAMRAASVQKNTVLSSIAQGRVAEVTVEGGAGESETPDGKIRYVQGRMTSTDLDVAGIARVVLERAASPTEPMRKLGGTFSLDGMQFSGPDGVEVKVGRAAGRDFYARPIADSWAGLFSLIPAMAEAGKPSEQDSARLVASMADFMGAFDYGSVEINGVTVTPPAKSGANASGRVARIAYTGSVGGLTPDARLEGLEITSPEGTARIGMIAFTGFSFGSTAEGLKALKDKRVEDLDPEALRRLMPTIGTIRFSGLDFDLPNEAKDTKPQKPERVRFTLKDLEFTADKPLNGVPTNLRLGLQNLAMPIDPNTEEEGLKDLASLGYKQLDLSFTTAASWNEAGSELVIREVSTRVPDMGTISLKGVIGNVTKDVFNADTAIATVALIGATAKNLDLMVENGGLFERFLTRESKKQSKTPEALRRELGAGVAMLAPALLGNSNQAKTIGQAVARFVAKPGRLSISAKTKSNAGLGFTDVMMLGDPVEILDKLDISAKSE